MAIVPLTLEKEGIIDTLKTYGLPEGHGNCYDFKYGRKTGETIVWMELLPESWSLVNDGDDLLLCLRQEVELQMSALGSSSTLVPVAGDDHGVFEDANETKASNQAARPIVRYRYTKLAKGLVQSVAIATSFLPDTYQEAVHTATSTLKQNVIAEDLEVGRAVLWARILDEKGNRIGAGVPPEQFIDLMRELLKKDPNCSIDVIPLAKLK